MNQDSVSWKARMTVGRLKDSRTGATVSSQPTDRASADAPVQRDALVLSALLAVNVRPGEARLPAAAEARAFEDDVRAAGDAAAVRPQGIQLRRGQGSRQGGLQHRGSCEQPPT